MDEIDKKILDVLVENARTPYKDIAKSAKISDVAVHKRIKKLEENVIKKFTVLVDQRAYEKNMTAILNIRCEVGKTNDIADKLKDIADITEVYTTVGDYDIIAKIRTRDTATLREIVEKQLTSLRGLNEIRTSIVFQCFKESMNLVM
jgi:Lrp/AsnC family transcriptional regulator for asnA, asnC and gidA